MLWVIFEYQGQVDPNNIFSKLPIQPGKVQGSRFKVQGSRFKVQGSVNKAYVPRTIIKSLPLFMRYGWGKGPGDSSPPAAAQNDKMRNNHI
jgi:hypothetical protein